MNALLTNFFNLDSLLLIYPLLLQGLVLTITLSLVALPTSLVLGLLVGTSYSFGGKITRRILIVLIDFLRSFPVLVLLILIFYGLPFFGLTLSGFVAVVIALSLNNTGYFGETFRAGFESVPKGQWEAAQALGIHRFQTLFLVILPQAIRKMIAPLASIGLELVKTTSIAALVALPELIRSARVAQEQTYDPTPLMAAAIIYFVMLWPFTRWVARLERKALSQR